MTQLAIWWIKRDPRLADNTALTAALSAHPFVLPVFCLEPSVRSATDFSLMHEHAQFQAVHHLRQRLRKRGAELFLGQGDAVAVFRELHRRFPFTHIYAHEEVGNAITFERDQAVAAWCREAGVTYQEFPQSSVRRSGVNRDRLQELWQQRVVQTLPLPTPDRIPQPASVRAFAAKTDFPSLKLPRTATTLPNGWNPNRNWSSVAFILLTARFPTRTTTPFSQPGATGRPGFHLWMPSCGALLQPGSSTSECGRW